jgi:transcriptional regulator with XRE-family HTH domain
MDIIQALKNRRHELGITQEELADIADVGLRSLKAIETGNANPTLDTLNKIANVMGMEVKLEAISKFQNIK